MDWKLPHCSPECSPEKAAWETSVASWRPGSSSHRRHRPPGLSDSPAERCHPNEPCGASSGEQPSYPQDQGKSEIAVVLRDGVLGWWLLRDRGLKQIVTPCFVLMTFVPVPQGQLCISVRVLILKSTDFISFSVGVCILEKLRDDTVFLTLCIIIR